MALRGWRGHGLTALRIGVQLALIVTMYRAAASVHEHAALHSHPDPGCAGICPADRPCTCGLSYSHEFPAEYSSAETVLLAGALVISLLGTHGLPVAARARRAAALAGVAYLAICPLSFDLSDWHGDMESFYYLPLGLASFPLNLLAMRFMLSDPVAQSVGLGGDPTFGRFSTTLAANLLMLGVCAYVQWFLLVPRLKAWVHLR